jgi:hypothetical protein
MQRCNTPTACMPENGSRFIAVMLPCSAATFNLKDGTKPVLVRRIGGGAELGLEAFAFRA